jgi:hypothetical protein
MLCAASIRWGTWKVVKYYGIPWILLNHWVVALTLLQHTNPEIPHYRRKEWTFTRGAAATVDRDFLGPMGKFFFHGACHHHVVHHFFPKLPFCMSFILFSSARIIEFFSSDHADEATRHLKTFLGDHYNFSSTPTLKTLWDTYRSCRYVEDIGKQNKYQRRSACHDRLCGL